MTNVAAADCVTILMKDDISASDVLAVRCSAFSSKEARASLRDAAGKLEQEAQSSREKAALAVCRWVDSQYEKALEVAAGEKSSAAAQFVAGRCLIAVGRFDDARDVLKPLAARTRNADAYAALAEAARRAGDASAASSAVREAFAKAGETAALHAEAGILADLAGDEEAALDHYRKALAINPDCVEALFRLAYLADLRGDADTALEFYQRCVSVKPVRSRALLNLGLLYEELGRDADAAACFRVVNERHPVNLRARLYLRDAECSKDMYFDEEQQKKRDRRNKILETPISDFELSVRSRNCLEKMNVTTIGDLCRITEQELLSFKNFGETSLNEIKAMMASKALRLGQSIEEDGRMAVKAKPLRKKPVDQARILAKPVDDLGLSVRAQHCMQTLGINTIGELVQKNENDLMQARNFGATSLTEVKKKLAAFGLSLAQ